MYFFSQINRLLTYLLLYIFLQIVYCVLKYVWNRRPSLKNTIIIIIIIIIILFLTNGDP